MPHDHLDSKISLPDAFNLGEVAELAAFVGAGGKTSLMVALANQLSGRVIITTTARMFYEQIVSAAATLPGTICHYPDLSPLDDVDAAKAKFLLVGPVEENKISGVPLHIPARLLDIDDIDTVLVEADGAKMLSVKAPAAHEPAIPLGATLVIPVIGIDALGQKIQNAAHRPELVSSLLGKKEFDRLTVDDLANLFINQDGGLKNVPDRARVIAAVNKVETPEQLAAAREIAHLILHEPRIEQVVISRALSERPVIEVHKRVTAVILAAGQSIRMGRSKQLLPWGETTVLGQTIRNLKETAVHNCLVVSGYKAGQIEAIAAEENVPTVNNPRYADGEMLSSLQTAIAQLPDSISAVLVMLADQPMIEPRTIDTILEAYWQGRGDIIAPSYGKRRGNPVLIDRRHFDELLALPPGSAPRDLLKHHEVHLVRVQSRSILQDIDEPEDYKRFRPQY